MNTAIVGGSITGNISECKVITTEAVMGRTLFVKDIKVYAVNNCTGEQETFQTWELAQGFEPLMILALISLAVVGIIWSTKCMD